LQPGLAAPGPFSTADVNGNVYSGNGQGRISLTQSSSGRYLFKGVGTFVVTSSPNNENLLNAAGQGQFQFGFDPDGSMDLRVAHARATVNYGSYAGDTTANGGVTVSVVGSLSGSRTSDATLNAVASGNLSMSARMNRNSDTNQETTITGKACRSTVRLHMDRQGILQVKASGQIRMGLSWPLWARQG
jgi:hypothetical protein